MLAYLRIIKIALLAITVISGATVASAMADEQNPWEDPLIFWYDLN